LSAGVSFFLTYTRPPSPRHKRHHENRKPHGDVFRARGFEPDTRQRDVLLAQEQETLLNCCRQAGKSTVTSALALHTALFKPKSDVLLRSPGQRQSQEIFRKATPCVSSR
jgi:hypothetical protein